MDSFPTFNGPKYVLLMWIGTGRANDCLLSPGGEEMFGEVAGSVIRWVSVFPLGNQLVSRGVDLVPSTYKPASPLEFNEKRLAPNRPAPLTCSITNAKTSKLPRYAYTSS